MLTLEIFTRLSSRCNISCLKIKLKFKLSAALAGEDSQWETRVFHYFPSSHRLDPLFAVLIIHNVVDVVLR